MQRRVIIRLTRVFPEKWIMCFHWANEKRIDLCRGKTKEELKGHHDLNESSKSALVSVAFVTQASFCVTTNNWLKKRWKSFGKTPDTLLRRTKVIKLNEILYYFYISNNPFLKRLLFRMSENSLFVWTFPFSIDECEQWTVRACNAGLPTYNVLNETFFCRI